MFATLEHYYHRLRRRWSRSEWAIRHLGLTPSEGSDEHPGLLLIQIDGLAFKQLQAAMAKGRMPFLKQLFERSHYQLHHFYSGLPSSTPAVQAELYYGLRCAVPAFSFLDRDRGQLDVMLKPQVAESLDVQFKSQAEGLLKGGSSWCNIYSGGASDEETSFCCSSNGLGDMWRTGKFRNFVIFIILNLPAVVRIASLLLLELVIAIPLALYGVLKGQGFRPEFGLVLSRTLLGIGLREGITAGGKVDVARGLPVVHLNFVGYDELAHRRGPSSSFAHWSLQGIDRAIKSLYRAAHRSRRRDYHVWVFSDHGQERTRSFATEFPGGIEQIISDCVGDEWPQLKAEDCKDAFPPGRTTTGAKRGFVLTAMGPVGHVYFSPAMDDTRKRILAQQLVKEKGVPGVLHRAEDGTVTWYHRMGTTAVPAEAAALLKSHPEAMRDEIARDMVALGENKYSGDLILLGWSMEDRPWTFAGERGAHAGLGPEEVNGFLLVPPATKLPQGCEHFVRPSALREAGMTLLGRSKTRSTKAHGTGGFGVHLRVMTYNAHSCVGMDGRVSPRRIARIIEHQSPDLVAVQELEHGRKRSRGEDQADTIGGLLGYQLLFCPTVTRGAERYGHAIFTKWPVSLVKHHSLPADPKNWWPEPRSAIWVRVTIEDRIVNFVTCHLGLSKVERMAQVKALLGPDWLGPVLKDEPVIICGDFNFSAKSPAYRLAARQLRDVQTHLKSHRPINTFSSMRPFVRLDHIFVSHHFTPERIRVPHSRIARLASDHLPVVADLKLSGPSKNGHRTD